MPLPSDAGTTRRVGSAFGVAMLLLLIAPLLTTLLPALVINRLPVRWVGVGLAAAGVGLRTWAQRSLGSFYTRTLRTAQNQTVVDRGPYAVLRHPGYGGALAMWLGTALASGNLIVLALLIGIMSVAYAVRIRHEEAMLIRALGEPYVRYCARTWRLVPHVF